MTWLFALLSALFGILIGGFLTRAAYVLPRGEYREILFPKCPYCGRDLPLRYIIPIVGPILSAFRCPHCGEKFGVKTLVSEILFAVACAFLCLVYGGTYLFYLYVVLAALLLILSLIDLDIKEISHSLLLVILILGVVTFVFSFFSFSLTGTKWWEHLVGAFVLSLPLFILMIVTGGAVGGGDVKYMFCIGLLLAYKLTLVAFFFGIILAAIAALLLPIICGTGAKFQVPLVPFLSLGTVIALLVGDQLIAALF